MKEPLDIMKMLKTTLRRRKIRHGQTAHPRKGQIPHEDIEVMQRSAFADNDIVQKMHPVNIKIIEAPC